MAMSRQEKVGVVVLISILSALIITLVFTIKRPTGPVRDFDESVIVQQRIRNLENDR